MPFRARMYIGSSVTSWPSSSTRPESGDTSPTTIENVVVLPAPFGPSRPTTSPDAISMFTPRTTVRPPKDLVRSVVRSVAIQLQGIGLVLNGVTPGMPSTTSVSSPRRKRSVTPSVRVHSPGARSDRLRAGCPSSRRSRPTTCKSGDPPWRVRCPSLTTTLTSASARSSSLCLRLQEQLDAYPRSGRPGRRRCAPWRSVPVV